MIEEVDEEVDVMSTLANERVEKRERNFKKSVQRVKHIYNVKFLGVMMNQQAERPENKTGSGNQEKA